MQLKTFILTVLLAAVLPVLAYEPPITEPGATGVNDLYTTADGNLGGPNHAPSGPNRTILRPGEYDQDTENFPVGAPWILLGFAAAYGAFRLKKGE